MVKWIGSSTGCAAPAYKTVRRVFMDRGQPLGKNYLFDEPLEIARRAAGLIDADGRPTVCAHRFRHTVGTQLAEGGAQIQTIMAILGHRSATMSATYCHISDPVLREQYEKVIAAGGRVVGPAAAALLANQIDQGTLDWLKTNYFKTEMELGHCLRTPGRGPVRVRPLADALRAGPEGLYAYESAAELINAHGTWLARDDSTRVIHTGAKAAATDWEAAIDALNAGGFPCSGGEQRMLRLAARLGCGVPVNLSEAVTGIEDRNVGLLVIAIRHASGRRQFPAVP
jgi:hypothetical protein